MNTCPYCQTTDGQIKNGLNPSGMQCWWCRACRRAYTPLPKEAGYAAATWREAVQWCGEGD